MSSQASYKSNGVLREEDECFREDEIFFSKQGGAGTCACHAVAKAVQ